MGAQEALLHGSEAASGRFLSAILVWLALMAAPCVGWSQVPQSGYLCCNMRSTGQWISDVNYAGDGIRLIPVGTPVTVTGHRRYKLYVQLLGAEQTIGNDYSRDLDIVTFAKRYIVAEDPRVKIASFDAATRDAIAQQRVRKGMSREQVLMAVGYPVTSENPRVDAKQWRFWLNDRTEFQVDFGDDDRVDAVTTDDLTRKLVVAE